jgi:protein-disulfide isomerase
MTKTTPKTVSEDAPGTEEAGVFHFKRTYVYSLLIPLAFVAGLASGFLFWGRDEAPSGAAADPTVEHFDVDTDDDPLIGPEDVTDPTIERFDVDADDDPFLGPEDAAVTIIEFSDFNCGYCRRFHDEVFPAIMAEYQDDIRFVYRDYPVFGGVEAAHAANCAGEQGAYWQYHDALFSGIYSMSSDGLMQYAQDLGLDTAAFQECHESERYVDEISGDLNDARGVGVTGTPTFFINGRKIIGAQPFIIFSQMIQEELDS